LCAASPVNLNVPPTGNLSQIELTPDKRSPGLESKVLQETQPTTVIERTQK
jgi:hypothetical protein